MKKRLVLLVFLSLVVVAGCGTYKKDLEQAKTQIGDLSTKNQRLSEVVSRVETEKASLMKERDSLNQKIDVVTAEVAMLRKANAELAQQGKALGKKNEQTEGELHKLKKENTDLRTQNEALKKQVASALAQTGERPDGRGESPTDSARPPLKSVSKDTSSRNSSNPCDAVLSYMKNSRSVVQQYKGKERASKLEEVRVAYESKMTEAPAVARKSAEEWVKEFSRSWDKTRDDSVIRLLTLKNAVLRGCGISPEDTDL